MVLESGGIVVLGGIVVMVSHQETLGDSASSIEGCRIYHKVLCQIMEQQKVKVKTLDTTSFSKLLSARIILKLKRLGAKIL